MSLTINRIGGSGGVSESNAILMAHVPTGSTVTASKGGVILTPKMWVSDSTADEDVAMFIFSPAQFDSVNAWTISATNGTDRASETVHIANNKEYEVILTYNYYLFKSGVGSVIPLSSNHEANSSISIGASEISINYTSSSGYQIFCCNTNAIDLSAFSALCVEGLITERQTSSQYGGSVAVASSMMVVSDDINNSKYVLKTPILTGSSMQTTILDISSIYILGYVGIRGGMKGTISAIYLKR